MQLRLIRPWRWVFLMGFGTLTGVVAVVAMSRDRFDGVTVLALLMVAILLLGILTILDAGNPRGEAVRKDNISPKVLHRTVSCEPGDAVTVFAASMRTFGEAAVTKKSPRG